MTTEPQFDDLFREVILDHYRRPRNFGELDERTHRLQGMNPVCGDEVTLDLRVENGAVTSIAFAGQGCSISQSSASMMTEAVQGASLDDALTLLGMFEAVLVDGAEPPPELGDLEALQGVANYPVRVKCALLCWKVLREGIEQDGPETKEEAHA